MYGYIKVLQDNNQALTQDNICLGAENINYVEGVDKYFDNIENEAKKVNVQVEHYIITSGMREFLMKTKIAKNFKDIYGSSYYYENNIAKWPNEVIESETKILKIKDINKRRDLKKNDCSNMIYIGDGMTDYYSMKFVKKNGGITICVHGDDREDETKLAKKGVVSESFERDFSNTSKLYEYLKEQISKAGEK